MKFQLIDKAWALFKIETGREDVTRENFKKLISRIRCAEAVKAAKSSSASSSSATLTTDTTGENDYEIQAIEEQRRKENKARKSATQTGNRPGAPPVPQLEADDIISTPASKSTTAVTKKTPPIQGRGIPALPKRLTLQSIAQVRVKNFIILILAVRQ